MVVVAPSAQPTAKNSARGRYFIAVAGEFLVCPQGRPLGSAQPMKGKEERGEKRERGGGDGEGRLACIVNANIEHLKGISASFGLVCTFCERSE